METQAKDSAGARRLGGLVLAGLMLAAFGMVARNVWLGRASAGPVTLETAPAPDWRAVGMRHDPPEGSRLTLPPVPNLAGKPVRLPFPKGVTVLMFLRWAEYADGDITELEHAVRNLPEARPVAVFGQTRPQAARRLARAEAKRTVVLLDPEGRLARAVNMVGKMRYYLIAPDGTLLFAENLLANGRHEEQRALAAIAQWKKGQAVR